MRKYLLDTSIVAGYLLARKKVFGVEHPDTQVSMKGYASLLRKMNQENEVATRELGLKYEKTID